MASEHDHAIRRAFTRQAAGFEDPRHNRVFTTDVTWIYDRLERGPDDLVLDVAAGTGHAARTLAPSVRAVVAIDVTPEMLETGARAAEEAGVRNVVFVRGDARALPFVDGAFDVVVCRFALHHFDAPAVAIAEMARCLRAGGRLLIADLVADDDPAVAERQNRLEHLRDSSHAGMLRLEELRALLEGAGLSVTSVDARRIDRPLGPWLEHSGTDDAAAGTIAAELRAELEGGPSTGFAPHEEGGELRFVQTFAAVVARA